jgi:glutathione S-transferase
MLRLNSFAISHFSEKVRWALDYNGLDYAERLLTPGAHMHVTRRLGKGTSVPVLEHDGTAIQGSSSILDYLEGPLSAKRLAAPDTVAERSVELERTVDRAFGLGIQRIFYDVLLAHKSTVVDMWTQGSSIWSRAFMAVAFPVVAKRVRGMYTIRPDAVVEAKDLLRRTMDTTDGLLEKSPYLLGDSLSRIDITVAALLAPMCRPPEHLLRWPTVMPEPLAAFLGDLEGRPTWTYVLRMYREHRRVS